jgi:hypothetical protein
LIGVFLLIGIVKKNAILIIDFALDAERSRGLSPLEAVREACLLRFRPILMTTLPAALGALPLAIGLRRRAPELRRPLGVAIIGGLIAEPAADADHDTRGLRVARQAAASRPGRGSPRAHREPHRTVTGKPMNSLPCRTVALALLLSAAGCAVGPAYQRPAFHRAAGPTSRPRVGWSPAPADALDRGPWWALFGDPLLDQLAAAGRGVEPERCRGGRRLRAGAGIAGRAAVPRCSRWCR